MPNRRIIFVSVVCLSITVFAAQIPSQTRSTNPTTQLNNLKNSPVGVKTADGLAIRWSAVTYRKKLYNPAVPPEFRDSRGSESLSLSCEILMANPMLLLGVLPDPVIEKSEDSKGNDSEFSQKQPAPVGLDHTPDSQGCAHCAFLSPPCTKSGAHQGWAYPQRLAASQKSGWPLCATLHRSGPGRTAFLPGHR